MSPQKFPLRTETYGDEANPSVTAFIACTMCRWREVVWTGTRREWLIHKRDQGRKAKLLRRRIRHESTQR